MSEEQFNMMNYLIPGIYRIPVFVFNIEPFLALSIVTN